MRGLPILLPTLLFMVREDHFIIILKMQALPV
jgi:hypothetical protein